MPYRNKWLLFFFSFSIGVSGPHFLQAAPPVQHGQTVKLASGKWNGYIMRSDGNVIPVHFDIQRNAGKIIVHIINGAEHLLVDNVRLQGDSVFINMPFFDSRFAARIEDSMHLTGNYIKNYGDRLVGIPFKAIYQDADPVGLVKDQKLPRYNISGRWAVLFRGAEDTTLSVGEFKQTQNQVTGTFLTITGDYRYLSGRIDGDTLRLSTFDGGHAYSFVSKIVNDKKMTGFFYAGAMSVQSWVADKNEQARLPDEYSLTQLKDPSKARLHFSYKDLGGHMVSLSDPKFRNKVVIIQILGSWCPNCMDETKFLAPWSIQNKSRGVELIGLAYERTESYADAKRLLQPFITRFKVSYPILPTGVTVSDSLRTQKTLPEIDSIVGFPTTIFIDKKGLVRKISTGFNGPGTGAHYDLYKKEFNGLVNSLLSE
jgi:thiol-disulfide isomerase/thioredoxin